ncbi:MAG: putative SOS response-associated peptidase YedK, partial [Glaciecola sp.]
PLLSCTLVTTAAAESFKPWHTRMPVMLSSDDRERWLDNRAPIEPDDPVFAPQLREALRLVPISRAAGNSRNKSPDSILPAGEWVTLPATDA